MGQGFPHRVFLADSRGNGLYVRVTWHPDHRQFVFSQWHDDICVSAVRVPVAAAPELLTLLANGLADAADHPVDEPPRPSRWVRLTARWRREPAPVVPLRRPGEGERDAL